jgi:hypothetical protein
LYYLFNSLLKPGLAYRPPPAQAQAHPAQAQAQAQPLLPPPPPKLPPLLIGGGLVTEVTLPVNLVTFDTTPLARFSTPLTKLREKSPNDIWGTPPPPVVVGV